MMKLFTFFTSLERPQKIAIILVIALIFHAIFVFSHPAYRYYEHKINNFYKQYNTFTNDFEKSYNKKLKEIEDKFTNQTIPYFDNVVSNTLLFVSESSNFLTTKNNPKNEITRDSTNSQILKDEITQVIGNIFSINGNIYLSIEGENYKVGDNFYGSQIIYIEPNYFETEKQKFKLIKRGTKNE